MPEQQDIALQLRCVHCFREQWLPQVFSISRGEAECRWCGKKSRTMTTEEYREAMRKLLEGTR